MRRAKPAAVALHLLITFGCLALFILRWVHLFRPEVVVINRAVTSHISNFALSLTLCALTGFVLLALGGKLTAALAFCLVVLLANVLYEAFLPILNTRDLTDAVYGIAGSLLGGAYACWLNRFGYREKAA